MKQPGFFDLDRRHKKLLKTRGFLENLNELVAWETFRALLDKALKRSSGGKGGRPAHDAVLMFKILILQALYNLSDEQTEYQILDRLSFMTFLGLELCDDVPEDWSDKNKAHKDTDARWTKKGGVAFYGYKNHVNVDRKHKLIRKYKVTDASVHDSQELDSVLDPKNDSQDTWADSVYRSEEQEARLKEQGQTSHIHERAYHNKPLTPEQEAANKARSSVRARIEHVFGHIETAMHGCYVRTIGIARARVKIGLEVLAYNMSRFTFLMRSRGTIAFA